MLMDDVCAIFNLKSAPEEAQVALVRTLLTSGKMKEAVTYTWKLGLQKHFSMTKVGGTLRDLCLNQLVLCSNINRLPGDHGHIVFNFPLCHTL